ncbi:MAG: bifunctional (p)ppGpp synthetase/guanosine-3',5'-bis(diphosphate) 3'-pyrophosphohydrolase [Candidatus Paceibacterota bacterium]|jgi:GTP pyrophosphokinase
MSTPKIIQKIIRNGSDQKLTKKAMDFAQAAHAGQKRASGEDYIIHPIRVAEILTQMNLDSKTIAAGLLHDVADDTDKTLQDIEKEFGSEVAFLVNGVSKLGKLRYPESGMEIKTVEERAEEPIDKRAENLRKMFFAMGEDLRVVLIKLADRLHNMETLGSLPPEKRKRIALETLEIYAPLADRLGMGEMKVELEGLAFPFLYPREYEWLINNVKERYEKRRAYLEKVQPALKKILLKEGVKILDMHSRAKSYWSLYQKLLRYDMNFEKIYDLIALRIIVKDVTSCYRALGAIHKHWKPLPQKIQDFIALPKPNGYQGLHTTVFCIDGKLTEFQIKTREMHEEAENGICSHWAYKQGIDLGKQGDKFAWVQQLRDWQKDVSKSKEFLEALKIDFFKHRIFVFTPRGDVIDLPEGATPVDFAYTVHTEIGNKCAGAKVNGKMVALSHILRNGDLVEIITEKNKKPSRAWLEFAKTSIARSRIKNWLKQESRPENLARGIKMLDEALKEFKGISFAGLEHSKKEEMLKFFSYKDLEGLLVAVGEGEVSPREILKKIFKEKEFFSQPQKPAFKLEKISGGKTGGISLAGQRGMQVFLAKCCLPKPGQPIKAYITRNRGASVHKEDCLNLIRAQKKWPHKIVEASWEGEELPYSVLIEIEGQDRVGFSRDIFSTVSKMGIGILSHYSEVRPSNKTAVTRIKVNVSGLEELDGLFAQLKSIDGVTAVHKV